MWMASKSRVCELLSKPVDVQIKECEGFLSRAHAQAELDAKRTTVSANIHDAEKRLEALKAAQQFAPLPPVDKRCLWTKSHSGGVCLEPRRHTSRD